MSEAEWENLDVTPEELQRFTQAFKSDEFKKLFAEYCSELNDTDNRRQYEKELIQLEAERGVDLTFIHPQPGYVIKSSANGNQKLFINVAKCDQVEKPTSTLGQDKAGQRGLNWSIPYVQTKPVRDVDRNGAICRVYDVIFHSDTLHLASKNFQFKKLVTETVCDAVQKAFNVELDMSNLKFPKMGYKGSPRSSVIRRKIDGFVDADASPIAHIFPKYEEATENIRSNSNNSNESKDSSKNKSVARYATPKYKIIHRRPIEMHELTDEIDAKINLTVPKELVVKIDLPLLRDSNNVLLDVTPKSLHLVSETPAKYKLKIDLPYEVADINGKASFDTKTKKLVIILPVVNQRKLTMHDLYREDSGVESDHHSPKEDSSSGSGDERSSRNDDDDDVFESPTSVTTPKLPTEKKRARKSIAVQPVEVQNDKGCTFLDSSISYILPQFTLNRFKNTVAFTLHVKNTEPESIQFQNDASTVHLKFSSIGCGYFPTYYAFYFAATPDAGVIKNVTVEAWDNNVIAQLEFDTLKQLKCYQAGLSKDDCKEFACMANDGLSNEPEQQPNEKRSAVDAEEEEKNVEVEVEAISSEELRIEIVNKCHAQNNGEANGTKAKRSRKGCKKNRSFSESHCDELKAVEQNTPNEFSKSAAVNGNQLNPCPVHSVKSRTYSESSNDDSHHNEPFQLKSILKRRSSYRSTSECSGDEQAYSCSVDLGVGSFTSIPEERGAIADDDGQQMSESVRKTVRFDKQLCRKLLFRINSTIVGQRKPKENKRKKKNRNQERRYSEGEASDYENNNNSNHDLPAKEKPSSNVCNGNCRGENENKNNSKANHRKQNTKGNDKKSENGLMFDMEI